MQELAYLLLTLTIIWAVLLKYLTIWMIAYDERVTRTPQPAHGVVLLQAELDRPWNRITLH